MDHLFSELLTLVWIFIYNTLFTIEDFEHLIPTSHCFSLLQISCLLYPTCLLYSRSRGDLGMPPLKHCISSFIEKYNQNLLMINSFWQWVERRMTHLELNSGLWWKNNIIFGSKVWYLAFSELAIVIKYLSQCQNTFTRPWVSYVAPLRTKHTSNLKRHLREF